MFGHHVISPREAYAQYMLGKCMFVDVREQEEAPGARPALKNLVHIPFSELEGRYGELPSDRPVVLMSWVGSRSDQALRFLSEKGYEDVAHVQGGFAAWRAEGFPVEG